MKRWFIILILTFIIAQASATVEDTGAKSSEMTGSVWPGSMGPPAISLPAVSCPEIGGSLIVTIALSGPTSESDPYTTPGKVIDYTVSVKNDGPSDVDANVNVNPENCKQEWFSWTTKSLKIPAGVSRSESLQVCPDISAVAGEYYFIAEASAQCTSPGSTRRSFTIQGFDYASETSISGTGQFQINKDVRSMDSGIKSNKEITFSGSVDALVKNEYLVDKAKGRVPNFEEQDAVDNYNALRPGDALFGTEAFKSSVVFGGVGANVLESYNVQKMEFKNQDFNLHQTGSLKKMAEFRTADNFTGFYLLDAKQVVPGHKSLKEHEEYLGSFDISRRLVFKGHPTFGSSCFGGSCNDFLNKLNTLSNGA